MSKRILVTDDEKDIREAVALLLKQQGFEVVTATDGLDAVRCVERSAGFDLIIMDIIMPRMDGCKAAEAIRKMTKAPILFLTAKSADEDKSEAYQAGGDDYLTKPFSSVELLLRVGALIKRYDREDGEIRIDSAHRQAYKKGEAVSLTDKEFDLLEFMVRNSGTVFSASQLYEHIWMEKYLPTSSNTVMVHILNLRKKLESDPTKPRYIQTVWGKGYCYAPE